MEEKEAQRIHIGGLGEKVTRDDINNTFSKLGALQSVDIIRTKGRSFAYIDFLPFSDNSLSKLFSLYNGCSWKGGKLKLEKAKEHYIDRLKREWAEDANLIDCKHINHVGADKNVIASPEPKSSNDLKDMELRLFFPKLKKIKSLPLRGTGKHKYSFQRVEASSLPVHFCACPEHSVPVPISRGKQAGPPKGRINVKAFTKMNSVTNRRLHAQSCSELERFQPGRKAQVDGSEIIQDDGINEEELNVMNSVMKKILDRGPSSKTVQKDVQALPQETLGDGTDDGNINVNAAVGSSSRSLDIQALREETLDDETDDDDIKINAVASHNYWSFASESWDIQALREETLDDETDDDDIKINAVAGHNFGSFASESRALRTSLVNMAKSNEQRTDHELPHQIRPVIHDEKVNPSDKKRKSLIDGSHEEDLTPPVHVMKSHMETDTKESGVRTVLKNVAEHETKKPITKGMWSQKSAWKVLVGDGAGSSFSLSQLTAGDDTDNQEKHKPGSKTSPDFKEHKSVFKVTNRSSNFNDETSSDSMEHDIFDSDQESLDGLLCQADEKDGPLAADPTGSGSEGDGTHDQEMHKPVIKEHKSVLKVVNETSNLNDETLSDSMEHDILDSDQESLDGLSCQADEKDAPLATDPAESSAGSEGDDTDDQERRKPDIKDHKSVPKVVSGTSNLNGEMSSDSMEHDGVNNSEEESLDGLLCEAYKKDCPLAAEPVGSKADSDKAARGNSWLQKSSWTQLVGGGSNSSFSISQILPGDLLKKQQSDKLSESSTVRTFSIGASVEEGETTFGVSQYPGTSLTATKERKDAQEVSVPGIEVSEPSASRELCDSTAKKNSDLEPKQTSSYPVPGIRISETCPFMRSADSLKEWRTAKTAVSNSLKKRNSK